MKKIILGFSLYITGFLGSLSLYLISFASSYSIYTVDETRSVETTGFIAFLTVTHTIYFLILFVIILIIGLIIMLSEAFSKSNKNL